MVEITLSCVLAHRDFLFIHLLSRYQTSLHWAEQLLPSVGGLLYKMLLFFNLEAFFFLFKVWLPESEAFCFMPLWLNTQWLQFSNDTPRLCLGYGLVSDLYLVGICWVVLISLTGENPPQCQGWCILVDNFGNCPCMIWCWWMNQATLTLIIFPSFCLNLFIIFLYPDVSSLLSIEMTCCSLNLLRFITHLCLFKY